MEKGFQAHQFHGLTDTGIPDHKKAAFGVVAELGHLNHRAQAG